MKSPPSSSAIPQRLSSGNARNLIDSVEAFLFECDGVLWKGDKLIDGVADTLEMLRSKGKKLVFLRKDSSKSRKQYAETFHSLGISVSEDEIFSSSFAAAMYLKVNNFSPEKKVYVIGEAGIIEELQLAGFTGLGGPEDAKKTAELYLDCAIEHDKSVGAVVVGIDRHINYYKLHYAARCLRGNPECLLIATNKDAVEHFIESQESPGAGCMVAAVTAVAPKIAPDDEVWKPSPFMIDFLSKKFQFGCSKMCMVSDRLDPDILFGQTEGCQTLFVFSGLTILPNLQDPSNYIKPDYYTPTVSDLLEFLGP